jgi:hypothetical protein
MVSSSRPGGRESDSISVMKPAEYLRPSCSWISRLGVVVGDVFDGFGGHGGCLRKETTSTAMVRRCSSSARERGQDLGEGDIAQGLETTSLISRQLLRAPHLGAMPHWWWSWLHSVRASGPSIASTTSNSEISMAGRVRR